MSAGHGAFVIQIHVSSFRQGNVTCNFGAYWSLERVSCFAPLSKNFALCWLLNVWTVKLKNLNLSTWIHLSVTRCHSCHEMTNFQMTQIHSLDLFLLQKSQKYQILGHTHSGLQQSARPNIRVSEGDEKWSDSETGKVIDGHNVVIFVYFLRQNAITTHKTRTRARI